MKKSEQLAINEQVVALVNDFNRTNNYVLNWRRLRSCSAEVAPVMDAETGELMYYVLRSYRTIVAAIDVRTDTLRLWLHCHLCPAHQQVLQGLRRWQVGLR